MSKPYYEQGKTDPVLMISEPSPIPDLMETEKELQKKVTTLPNFTTPRS